MKRDLTGKTFGRLVVLKEDVIKGGKRHWVCKCVCGKIVSVYQNHLERERTRSCGCLRKDEFTERLTKHGMAGTKIYRVYMGMLERCYYKKHKTYKDYGGRGITVCKEWRDKKHGFDKFYFWAKSNGYKEGLTLERANNNNGYSPKNCSWITRKEQGYNKRNTVKVTVNGESKTFPEWSEELGINVSTLRTRHLRGTFP